MSAFHSGASDYRALRRRREELFGEPPRGAENGVDTTPPKPAEPEPPDPGHYPGH